MTTTTRDAQALTYCGECGRIVTSRRRLRRGMCCFCYQDWLLGCWNWTGTRTKGYGQFSPRIGMVYAHRFAYELERGPIPDGLTVDHLCHNRACVNPAHLEIVTVSENTKRAHRHKCPHCDVETTVPNLQRHMLARHSEVAP